MDAARSKNQCCMCKINIGHLYGGLYKQNQYSLTNLVKNIYFGIYLQTNLLLRPNKY